MAIIPCSINETNFVWSFIWNLPATLHHPATFNHDMTRDGANMTRQPLCHHGTARPLILRLLHPSLSPPRPLTPLSNPAADDMRITYFSPAAPQECATLTAIIPTSHDVHPTTLLLSTSLCGSVPSLTLFLHASDSRPATDRQ